MKKISIILIFLGTSWQLISQSILIDCGVIFTDEYKVPVKISKEYTFFTPSYEDIEKAEKIFITRYNEDLSKDERYIKFKNVKNVKKKYKHHKRQYVGVLKKNGDKIIYINLLNFKHKRKVLKYYKDWRNDFIVGFGGFYEENTISYSVDLVLRTVYLGPPPTASINPKVNSIDIDLSY